MEHFGQNLFLVHPEITLAIGAMLLLLIGVFRGDGALRLLSWLAVIVYGVAAFFVTIVPADRLTAFNDLFVTDGTARFLKLLIYSASAISTIIAIPYLQRRNIGRFEYPIIIMLATTGMSMMVSANDLITLYVSLELQSLALYVLASIHRDNAKSTEAGLKYFVLGALSSGLLLYGCSLVYGFAGTTNFEGLRTVLHATPEQPPVIGVLFGMIFVIVGIAFKISAVPFHMWTPDVYEGSPTPVTAFFASAPKVAAMGLLLRVLFDAFGGLGEQWRQIIMILSALSMGLGAIAALGQTNIKRLLAYSSIGHIGYALIGVAVGNHESVSAVLIYLVVYVFTTLASFLCVLPMQRNGEQIEDMSELGGLAVRQPKLALAFTLVLFSLAGVPPLMGFWAKFYIFKSAIELGGLSMTLLAVWGVLTSVIATAYYLRLIKIMWFDKPSQDFDKPVYVVNDVILTATTLFVSPLGWIFLGPLQTAAIVAARALIGSV